MIDQNSRKQISSRPADVNNGLEGRKIVSGSYSRRIGGVDSIMMADRNIRIGGRTGRLAGTSRATP